MAQMNISSTLWNDTKEAIIAFAKQLKDNNIDWTNEGKKYNGQYENPDFDPTKPVGPDNPQYLPIVPDSFKDEDHKFQDKLNEFFLNHWADWKVFLNDHDLEDDTINTWKELQDFLQGLPDDQAKWLLDNITRLDNRITAMDIPDGGAYDISADHVNEGGIYAEYEDLSSALEAVAQERQKPGMTIRFINLNTHKYEQYRLLKNEWSTDIKDWAIDEEDFLVDNPEYVKVLVDADDRILEATRTDGSKLFGANVDVNGNLKVEGNVETSGYVQTVINNPEFVKVTLDKNERILWGIKADGTIFYGAGVPPQVQEYVMAKIQEFSPENYDQVIAFLQDLLGTDTTLKMMLDAMEAEIQLKANQSDVDEALALKANTSDMETALEAKANTADVQTALEQAAQATATALEGKVDKEEGKSLIDSEFASSQSVITNPEWIDVKTDSEDKILEATRVDGTKVINTDLELNGKLNQQGVVIKVMDNPEYIDAKTDSDDKLLEATKKDGTKVIGGDLEIGGDVVFKNGVPQQIIDYVAEHTSTGTGVESLEYDDATGDMYATYDDESGVTDVYMEPNGDIYVESEE